MHCVLSIHNVVSQVVSYYEENSPEQYGWPNARSLQAIALVNHMFFEHALDRLWACTGIWELARLMPAHLWKEEVVDSSSKRVQHDGHLHILKKHRRVLVCHPSFLHKLALMHRSRFWDRTRAASTSWVPAFFCIPRRRENYLLPPFTATPLFKWWGREHRCVDGRLMEYFRDNQTRIFPCLSSLNLDMSGITSLELTSTMTTFISPRIVSLELSIAGAYDPIDIAQLQPLIETLTDQCTSLTHFTLSDASSEANGLRAWQPVISAIIKGSTRWIKVVCRCHLAEDAFMHLAEACAQVQSLTIGPLHTQLFFPAQSFPLLDNLHLTDGKNVASAFLERHGRHTSNLRSLKYFHHVDDGSDEDEPENIPFVTWIVTSRLIGAHSNLTTLYLAGDEYRGDQAERQSFHDSWQFYEPLLALVCLQDLWLYAINVPLREQGSYKLLRRWPQLISWEAYPSQPSEMSLEAFLQALAACPAVKHLPVVVDCSHLPSDDTIKQLERLTRPIRRIEIQGILQDVKALAQVIRRCLPSVGSNAGVYNKAFRDDGARGRKLSQLLVK